MKGFSTLLKWFGRLEKRSLTIMTCSSFAKRRILKFLKLYKDYKVL